MTNAPVAEQGMAITPRKAGAIANEVQQLIKAGTT